MISKLKRWYRSKVDAIKFWLMLRWTKDRGLSIVQIVTIEGTDFIATSNGTLREISKTDFIIKPQGKPEEVAMEQQAMASQGTEEQGEVCIELKIGQQGDLSVGIEIGEEEQQSVPVANIDEACMAIKKMYAQIMSEGSEDQKQENAAFTQEMANPAA